MTRLGMIRFPKHEIEAEITRVWLEGGAFQMRAETGPMTGRFSLRDGDEGVVYGTDGRQVAVMTWRWGDFEVFPGGALVFNYMIMVTSVNHTERIPGPEGLS
jgi:hypothetical protein